jgi:hypothetical protein
VLKIKEKVVDQGLIIKKKRKISKEKSVIGAPPRWNKLKRPWFKFS